MLYLVLAVCSSKSRPVRYIFQGQHHNFILQLLFTYLLCCMFAGDRAKRARANDARTNAIHSLLRSMDALAQRPPQPKPRVRSVPMRAMPNPRTSVNTPTTNLTSGLPVRTEDGPTEEAKQKHTRVDVLATPLGTQELDPNAFYGTPERRRKVASYRC
jgi:hypothetical protein